MTDWARVNSTLKLRSREAKALPGYLGYLTVVLQMVKYFAEIRC